MTQLPEHLGGHLNKTHIDEGSLLYMINEYKITSMLDIGCGPGGMVSLALKHGINAYGIDGDFEVERKGLKKEIIIHDYETGPSIFDKQVDLIWSCEFVEHVYEKYLPNFMADFQKGKYIIMTYAPVGKEGHHHVNCNTEEYWIETFYNYGFDYNKEITATIRNISTMNKVNIAKPGHPPKWKKSKNQYIQNYGLFFEKRDV